jgi:soluble lytic murein transglycosylase-like protein
MIRNKTTYLIAALVCLLAGGALFFTADASAEIYSYTDENGVLHFSNAPTSARYRYAGPETARYASAAHYYTRRMHDYDNIIREASRYHGIQFGLIKAMIHAESGFNPTAISPSGAMGLMQIMPANLNEFGVSDPFNPRDNVMGGTRYLKSLMAKYNSDLPLTLAAYNAGPGVVDKYKTIPPYPETEKYVEKVLRLYSQYQNFHP